MKVEIQYRFWESKAFFCCYFTFQFRRGDNIFFISLSFLTKKRAAKAQENRMAKQVEADEAHEVVEVVLVLGEEEVEADSTVLVEEAVAVDLIVRVEEVDVVETTCVDDRAVVFKNSVVESVAVHRIKKRNSRINFKV